MLPEDLHLIAWYWHTIEMSFRSTTTLATSCTKGI